MSSDFRRFAEEDDDYEDDLFAGADEGELDHFVFKKTAMLFAIDASDSMRVESNGSSPLSAAITAAVHFMQDKIKESSDTDQIGLLFFGVDKFKNNPGVKNVYLYQELDLPDINRILELERLGQNSHLFDSTFGPSAPYSIADLFWVCNDLFSRLKNYSRQILLITNRDMPPLVHDKNVETQAHVRFRDLRQLGCEFELFAIRPSSDEDFDFDKFYAKLPMFFSDERSTEEEEEENQLSLKSISPDNQFEQLKVKMKTKEARKRTSFRVPFHIGKDLTIGLKGFNLFMKKKKPNAIHLDSASSREVKSTTVMVCQSTGLRMNPIDLRYYYIFGGEKAIFTKEEWLQSRSFGEPGLTLLGFKPRESLKIKHNIRPSVFLVPDEGQYAGSHSLFAHLHERLASRQKVAIGLLIARKTSIPRFVAIYPSDRERSDDMEEPYGFHAIILPFGDDMRHIPADPAHQVDVNMLEVAKKIVDAAQLDTFEFSAVPNPAIERHFAVVESLALRRDEVPEMVDRTLPDIQLILQEAGDAIELFNQLAPEEEPVATGRKRSANAETSSSAKRSKSATDDSNIVELTKSLYAQNNLSKLTVAQLKDFLASVKISPKGKKADLLSQVSEYLSKH